MQIREDGMPFHDGTGPWEFGSGTGRGRGLRRGFSFMRAGFGTRRIGFLGAMIPVAAAALRDLSNPNGLLRSTCRKLISQKTNDFGKPVDASFTVID
jgi:hypothetical protein